MDPIKIVILGDFCAITPERLSIGFHLQNILDSCDLRCVNFEGPIPKGTVESANGSYLNQSERSPDWLVDHGFNVVLLANNHACDFGGSGLRTSREFFSRVLTLGSGNGWSEAYGVRYVNVKGKRIGFFNATSADFSSLKDPWTDSDKYGCAWINHPTVPLILQKAKLECDWLIVLPHAGVEYMDVPLPEWRTIYRNLIDFGCDAVIASHPHVPQGWEIYKGKPIYYSLGNFVFEKRTPSTQPNWYNGLAVELSLLEDRVLAQHYSILYQNDSVDIDSTQEQLDYIKSLGAILSDDTIYMKHVNETISTFANKYEQWMFDNRDVLQVHPFTIRTILKFVKKAMHNNIHEKIFLHQLREESTRWSIIRHYYLKAKITR